MLEKLKHWVRDRIFHVHMRSEAAIVKRSNTTERLMRCRLTRHHLCIILNVSDAKRRLSIPPWTDEISNGVVTPMGGGVDESSVNGSVPYIEMGY